MMVGADGVAEGTVMKATARLLIIDDDVGMRETIGDVLQAKGYAIHSATRGADGLARLQRSACDAAIVDIKLPDISGVDLLQSLRTACPDLEVIFITGYASLPTALQAINGDAFAYLIKPFEMDHLLATLNKALDRQRLARALRESEERYRLIAEHINDAIVLTDLEGRLVFANGRAEVITGYTAQELTGLLVFNLLTPEGSREAQERLVAAASGGEPAAVLEAPLRRKDGSLVWIEANMASVRSEGRVVGRLGVLRDISERKRAEQKVRLQASALDAAASGIVITDREGTIIWANPGFTSITGYSLDEVTGQTSRVLKSGHHDAAFYQSLWETILAGQTWRGEIINRRKDGALYPEEQTITPVRDEQGEITHFLAIKEDITERKRLQEHLTQSEKLAAMGQLLASVAHELNNPLSVLTGHAALLKSASDQKVADRAVKMIHAAERCARIVRNFLTLARQRPPERTRVDLNQVVRDALELVVPDPGRQHRAGPRAVRTASPPHCRRSSAPSGRDQSIDERAAGVAGGPDAATYHGHHAGRGQRALGRAPGGRQRARHLAGDPGQAVRAVLHDQAAGRGHGAGAGHLSGHRQHASRHPPGGERPRSGRHFPHGAAGRGDGSDARCRARARVRGQQQVDSRRR